MAAHVAECPWSLKLSQGEMNDHVQLRMTFVHGTDRANLGEKTTLSDERTYWVTTIRTITYV
jgi:hypothetical protein